MGVCCAALGCGGGGATPDGGAPDAGVDGGDAGPDGGDGGMPDAGPFEPDGFCPGGPGCPDEGDGALEVGAAAVAITPDPATEDEPIWIAGFGLGREATGVNDDQWVRVVALRQNETTLVIGAVDCVGYFRDEVVQIREMVSDLDVDFVHLSATHVHEARDTLGIWGPDLSTSGANPEYMTFIREQAAQAVRQAMDDLRPANVQYASLRLRDAPGGMIRYLSDNRDPRIIDDEVRIMRFPEAEGDGTIATLVNLGSHPEYAGSDNTLLSSDYPHWLREGVENGATGPDGEALEGVGGVAVFVPGALGGQIGPNELEPARWDGSEVEEGTLETPEVVGSQLAWLVLDALGPDGGSVTDETADLGYRNVSFLVDVENRYYHAALVGELFYERETYNWDPDRPLLPGRNEPDLKTEVAVIDVGRARMISVPGELHPELFVGGYDGSHTPQGFEIVDADNPNPPELSMAPDPPYLRDRALETAERAWLLGLGNDMLGYLIPEYNYVLGPGIPYLTEAEGDHYEETNSVGERGWPTIERNLHELLAWSPER